MTIIETLAREAAHRRDHVHGGSPAECPQAIDLVYCGCNCFVVCHHCSFDTELMDPAHARAVAGSHHCP